MPYVTKKARPKMTASAELLKQESTNLFWSLPKKYFEIERNDLYLSSDVAHLIKWNIDEKIDENTGNVINVNAYPQKVTINGNTYSIDPGAFCSHIKREHFIGNI